MTDSPSRSELESLVREIFAGFGPAPEEVTPAAELDALDLDSLDLVELVQILDEDHGIVVPEGALGIEAPATVGEVVERIARALS